MKPATKQHSLPPLKAIIVGLALFLPVACAAAVALGVYVRLRERLAQLGPDVAMMESDVDEDQWDADEASDISGSSISSIRSSSSSSSSTCSTSRSSSSLAVV